LVDLADRFARQTLLSERMKEGTLAAICRVVRDLSFQKKERRLNEGDKVVFERATRFLLNEWCAAFSIPLPQAERELKKLLG
jgi:RNA polymerase-interacting CarD/CdnL/TRCF family regulator